MPCKIKTVVRLHLLRKGTLYGVQGISSDLLYTEINSHHEESSLILLNFLQAESNMYNIPHSHYCSSEGSWPHSLFFIPIFTHPFGLLLPTFDTIGALN